MNAKIENPAVCEIRSVIRFLNATDVRPVEIHRQIKEVYGQNVMNEANVRKWCRLFNEGRTNVHDEHRSGRPSLVTDKLVQEVDQEIRRNRRFTISELHTKFPQISRSLVHEIVTERLHYRKLCSRWVPKMLTQNHKDNRMAAALNFLERYHNDGDEFLDHIITGDETWVCHVTPESKQQSMQWRHSGSPKPKKFKQTLSAKKIMATVFWDRRGVLLVEFMPQGTTINADVYCETLKKLKRAIQNKRRGLLTAGVCLIHDNARPHTALRTRALLDQFKWDIFQHPAYSPDLAPSDYHLFLHLKTFLAGQHLNDDEEVKEVVTDWMNHLAADFFDDGIQKLVTRYDKCLNLLGDYVEK